MEKHIDPTTLNLPLVGIDSHAHVVQHYYKEDFNDVLERAYKSGVSAICNVFMGIRQYEENALLFPVTGNKQGWPTVFFALGIHPSDAHKHDLDVEIPQILEACKKDPRIKAIGETGLDFYWKECPPKTQKKAFRMQLDIALKLDLPVVIHAREACEEALEILLEKGFSGKSVLWHCFGENTDFMQRVISHNWYISIPGTCSYPKNTDLRETIALIPQNRLVVETDCPYLSHQSWRGTRNEPAYVALTAQTIAEIYTIPTAQLWETAGNNSRTFFRLLAENTQV